MAEILVSRQRVDKPEMLDGFSNSQDALNKCWAPASAPDAWEALFNKFGR